MDMSEVAELLGVAAAFDQRTVGEFDVGAWHATLDDVAFDDARQAVIDHYRNRRDRVMPADIRDRVGAVRRARLEAFDQLPDPLPGVDPDDPEYFARLREVRAAAAASPIGHALTLSGGQG